MFKEKQHRIGNRPYTQLQSGTILDKRPAMLTYRTLHIAYLPLGKLKGSMGGLNDAIDIRYVYQIVSPGNVRHLIVNLCDNRFCALARGLCVVARNPKRAEPLRVGGRHLN